MENRLILNVMTLRQDDPITLENCMHILCLLSSTDEFGNKIRGLGGVEKTPTDTIFQRKGSRHSTKYLDP